MATSHLSGPVCQEIDGGQAKPYQVKQVWALIRRHNLGELDDA